MLLLQINLLWIWTIIRIYGTIPEVHRRNRHNIKCTYIWVREYRKTQLYYTKSLVFIYNTENELFSYIYWDLRKQGLMDCYTSCFIIIINIEGTKLCEAPIKWKVNENRTNDESIFHSTGFSNLIKYCPRVLNLFCTAK